MVYEYKSREQRLRCPCLRVQRGAKLEELGQDLDWTLVVIDKGRAQATRPLRLPFVFAAKANEDSLETQAQGEVRGVGAHRAALALAPTHRQELP